jgi:hypothetical protein
MTAQRIEARRVATLGAIHESLSAAGRAPEMACLCGARQPTPHPIKCWNCDRDTMGQYQEKTR